MEKPKKPLLLLLSLLLAASAAWAASPLSSPIAAATPASTPLATLSPAQPAQGGPPLSLTLMLAFTCCALGAVLGLIVLGIIVNVDKRKAAQTEAPPSEPPSQ